MILAQYEGDSHINLWREIKDLGWLGLAFPLKQSGEDGNYLNLVLLEEMERVCFTSPQESSAQ